VDELPVKPADARVPYRLSIYLISSGRRHDRKGMHGVGAFSYLPGSPIKYNIRVNIPSRQMLIQAVLFVSVLCSWGVCPAGADTERATLQRGIFTIDYPASQQGAAERTLAILEEAVQEFSPMLPVGDLPVHFLMVDVPEEFDRYAVHFAGLEVSGLAQPGNGLIIVKAPRLRMPDSDYPGTLRHELVHLLLFRNLNEDYLPQWLNEGLAMSLANEFYWQAMFAVARMFIQNRIIPLERLDESFYSPSGQMEFNDAYAQSLSMTRYLRNRLGEEVFWRVVLSLRDMPFPQALQDVGGLSLDDLWTGYRKALWKYAIFATMASGFFFQPAAILLIIAYIRYRRKTRRIYQRWEAEEAEEKASGGAVFHWEDVVEDPDAWKRDLYEDEESW